MTTLDTVVYATVFLLSLAVVFPLIVLGIGRTAAAIGLAPDRRRRLVTATAVVLAAWLALTTAISVAGGLAGAVGPLPRVVPVLAVPLLAGIAAYRWAPDFRAVVLAAPLHWLVGMQAFRLGAMSFLALVATGLAPRSLIIVGLGDVIAGAGAVAVARYLRTHPSPRPLVPLLFTGYAFADLVNGVVQIAILGRTADPTTQLFQQFPLAYVGTVTTPLSFLLMGFVLVRLARARREVPAAVSAVA